VLVAPKNGAPSPYILGYSPGVPTALALSVHGNLPNTKLSVQLTKLRTETNRDRAWWVIERLASLKPLGPLSLSPRYS
jgi:hypothetical protein